MSGVLVLSRQPLQERPLQDWLPEILDDIILVTPRPRIESSTEALKRFRDHRVVDDYHSWNTERVAEQIGRLAGVHLVASTSEYDVLRAARLRTRLGLPGQTWDGAVAYRDKVVMKGLVEAAGLRVPSFAAVDGPLDLLDFIDAVGYPVVVKPRFGAGAEGFVPLRDDPDVDAFLNSTQSPVVPAVPGQWMAESFVTGDLFHVDGIMVDGRVVHGWPSQYNTGVAEHTRDGSVLSSVLLAIDDARWGSLMTFTADVISRLPPTSLPSAFHLEAWMDHDGEPILCEIASRAGGGPIAETYQRAFGVHLAREGLRAQCGLDLSLTSQPLAPDPACGWVVFPPGNGIFAPPAEECPVAGVELILDSLAGSRASGLRRAADAAAHAVVTGDDAVQVRTRLSSLVEWWSAQSVWTAEEPAEDASAALQVEA